MPEGTTIERRLWQAIEPVHALVYFAPGPIDAARAVGLRGFWMGYFASRFAPLGPLPAGPVTAMAFGFAPSMVERSIPDAWSFADPETVLGARLESAGAELRERLGEDGAARLGELGALLWEAVAGCEFDGRPLAAGWAGVARPDDPVVAAWLATAVLREHRGDGHVLACVANGLSGLEATVSFVAGGSIPRATIQPHRGWSDGEWAAAEERLRERGLMDADGGLTRTGIELRSEVEALTDRLAASATDRLGDAGAQRAIELATPLSRALVDGGVVPVPNPVGAPRP